MKTTIENYRGIDIWFDTEYETFSCDVDHENSVKKSYPAVKKFIDDWKKDAANFKSFRVCGNPNSYYGGKNGTIIGIRKDGRFVLENEKGEKEQVSDSNLKDFILYDSANIHLFEALEKHRLAWDSYKEQHDKISQQIKSKFIIKTLKDVKANYAH